MINDEADATAILGPPLPPDELTMGDYPELRLANQVEFHRRATVIVGANGSGKTSPQEGSP